MSQDGIDSVVGKRGLFMCRIASLFLLRRLKGSMSGDVRYFNNIETRAVVKFFFQGKAPKEIHVHISVHKGPSPGNQTEAIPRETKLPNFVHC